MHHQPAVEGVGRVWLKREGYGYSCYAFAVLADTEGQDYRLKNLAAHARAVLATMAKRCAR